MTDTTWQRSAPVVCRITDGTVVAEPDLDMQQVVLGLLVLLVGRYANR